MEILITIVFLGLSYLVGTKWIERKHFESINRREKENLSFPVVNMDKEISEKYEKTWLVSGNTVISIDPFKKFIANLVNFFGGNIVGFESLLDRARRESILRMISEAKAENADAILNMRIETSTISGKTKDSVGTIEILAYGTAVKHAS